MTSEPRQIISTAVFIVIGLFLVKFGYNVIMAKRLTDGYLPLIGIFSIIMGIAVFVFLFDLVRK